MDDGIVLARIAPVVPLIRLVILAADRKPGKKAEKKRTGTAMTDNSNIARGRGRFHCFEAVHNALLHIDGPLPSANAFVWGRKELVGNHFVLVGRQKAGGASVDFTKTIVGRRNYS